MKSHKFNLIHYFNETVLERKNDVAIEMNDTSYTFEEVDSLSDTVAQNISLVTKTSNQPIITDLGKSCETIIVFIGILKSGNYYVPLDSNAPLERKRSIRERVNGWVVYDDDIVDHVLVKRSISLKNILIPSGDNSTKSNLVISTKPAYAIFTSGSTGQPKGVVISHQSVIDYILWANSVFKTDHNTVIGNQAPFHFDNSVLDIYQMIILGARLVLIPEDKFVFPKNLMQFLSSRNINFVFWVPSVLAACAKLNALDNGVCESLKTVVFAGEVMQTSHLNYWISRYPTDTRFVNLYGPTEITVDCTYYEVNRKFEDHEILPIGLACDNTGIMLLDSNGKIINTQNVKGEICVSGVGLSLGYFSDPQNTLTRFVQTPEHDDYKDLIYRTGDYGYFNDLDELMFMGRLDSQIKFQGYRIELGEIENVVIKEDHVSDTCVVYDSDKGLIKCFYEGSIDESSLRKYILRKLPKYMVPKRVIKLEKLPLNRNGKIDRVKLQAYE